MPVSIAFRNAKLIPSGQPRSRTVVTPECNVSLAWRAARRVDFGTPSLILRPPGFGF